MSRVCLRPHSAAQDIRDEGPSVYVLAPIFISKPSQTRTHMVCASVIRNSSPTVSEASAVPNCDAFLRLACGSSSRRVRDW